MSEEQKSSSSKSHRQAAVWVALGIFLSRVSGLVRDRVFAHYLGSSSAAGAFRAALRIPNFLQNLFGEGVLSASFIPVYARLIGRGDHETAGKVAGVVAAVLGLAVSLMVLLGVWLTPSFVDLVAPGFQGEVRLLTIQIVRILFPGVGLLVLSALCLGILNSHGRFFLSYVAPVLWNAAMIGTLILYGRSSGMNELAIKLAWGSVLGSFLQLSVQLPFVWQSTGGIRFALDLALSPVREVFRNLGPILLSRGVVQLSAYIDGMIASFLGAGAVASLAYAQTIYLLPVSLFGMSVAAAELPEMSRQASQDGDNSPLRMRVNAGTRNIAVFVIPSVAAILFLGRYIVSALYQTGHFGADDTLFVWYILMGAVVGLLAATWGRLYSSAFYALGDIKTPLKFAVIRVILTATLGLLFAFPLRPYLTLFLIRGLGLKLPQLSGIDLALGTVGLTSSAGIAGWIEYALLKMALRRRIGDIRLSTKFVSKVWLGALCGVGAGLALARLLEPYSFISLFRYDLRPIFTLIGFGAVYLGCAELLGIGEVRRLWRRLRGARG